MRLASRLFLVFALLSQFSVAAAADSETYKDRYSERLGTSNQLMSKITDNRGDGFEDLYGTRNFRAVLHGVYYRGGANNYYHRSNARNNMNPLPQDGLDNLCKEGFKKSIYFYETNFVSKQVSCDSRLGGTNSMAYTQVTALSDKTGFKPILSEIFSCIQGGKGCPIYGHCWNGWHASGLVAAIVLRQYCDLTPVQGVEYWIDGTDSVENSNYPAIKKTITNFVPFPEFAISAEAKKEICPINPYQSL
jgi:hypothetical protein